VHTAARKVDTVARARKAAAARWENPVETLVASAVTGVIPGMKKAVVADGAGYGVEVVKGDVCMECTEIGRHALLCSQRPRVALIEGRKVAKAGRVVSGAAKGVTEGVETAQERAQRLYIEKMEKKK
jgi:hypothetical protein